VPPDTSTARLSPVQGSCILTVTLRNEAAREYARHGFVRRLGTLKRCIENVYSRYPPERFDKPSRNECLDLAINLQSFMFNVFGCIDNLAWVWDKDKEVRNKQGRPLRSQQVGLRSGCVDVYQTFSPDSQNQAKLDEHNEWERRKDEST
jgi:hypothetical protein